MTRMSLASYFDATPQNPPLTAVRNLEILRRSSAFQVRERRVWRRRRLKTNRHSVVVVRSQLGLDHLFQNYLSQFPSVNSLDLIAPALGFASGVSLFLSRSKNPEVSDVGEWILFTSPTPFNRFVVLRCPSISLEEANERLVEEDRHFVRLNSGRIQARGGDNSVEETLAYQRECVATDDGGVISLDWPANLDLREEHGLDTTILLVPGTAEGSMDRSIRSFVCESLMRGYFPVVVNPRGCAGSPLTTPRLFTAADSDDICTAIKFINRARPWTTLMGVGWGYGANMLTKYLAEVGERTPLTAATCVDNPFDLEEATRSTPYRIVLDQKLTDGFKDILRSNKELFRGRAKGFDVEKALLAKSVRDFENAISVVSCGFDAIEDFYAKSSTRGVIGNVKIPVLFIQNDDGSVPLFSIPRSSIAGNPFTSLLLCSCSPSKVIASGRSAICWYQHLTVEWLAAVELGLLKGRHPLLKDVDVTLNPSKALEWAEGRASNKSESVNNFLNGRAVKPLEEMFGESDTSVIISSKSRQDSRKNAKIEDKGLQQESNGLLEQTSSLNAELVKDEVNPIDYERGQVLQTAQVVMNMLDATMPNTLTEERKEKVLTAVGQGETVMKALQDAVPEDVREKLTTSMSEILQNPGTNLKLDRLLNIGQLPTVASELKSKIKEKIGGLSSVGGYEDPHYSDSRNGIDDLADNSNGNHVSVDKSAGGLDSEDTAELEKNHENAGISRETASEYSGYNENVSDVGDKPDFPGRSERADATDNVTVDQHKVDQNGGLDKLDMKEEDNSQQNIEQVTDSSTDQTMTMPSTKVEKGLSHPVSSSEAQPTEREGIDNLKKDEKSMLSVLNQNSSDSPTFSVSQALDALSGIDDSTQVAVNSVFGVIEDMITQLEDNETKVNDKKDVEECRTDSAAENHRVINENDSARNEENKNDLSSNFDMVDDLSSYDGMDLHDDARGRWAEEERPLRSHDPFQGNSVSSSSENDMVSLTNGEIGTKELVVSSKLLAEQSNKVRPLYNAPPYIITDPYNEFLYKEYLRKYLLSKMHSKSSTLDTPSTLFLDYIPEEGQWKLVELRGNSKHSAGDLDEGANKDIKAHSPSKADTVEVIEPLYVIMDAEEQQEPVRDYDTVNSTNQKVVWSNCTSEELMSFIKNIALDSLKVEVDRRLNSANTKEMEPNLARDLEEVANAVSLAAGDSMSHMLFLDGKDCNSEKQVTLNGEHIVEAISLAVQESTSLRRVLPVGVVVGSTLAALRKFVNVATVNGTDQREAIALDQINHSVERGPIRLFETEADVMFRNKIDRKYDVSRSRDGETADSKQLNNGKFMVGAVTAAIGASALLVHQQGMKDSDKGNETSKTLSKSFEDKQNHQKEPDKLEEEISEKSVVTSFAEKAMSVAGPVVPMKEDGEVDHERLVAMLAELGQKGGMLKLVGKIALLWGGIRGAISLTDKLILFLRIAERPLFQRILGFVCMVLVLWSPVVVPLLPTLVKSWATHNSSKIAELVCIFGLYAAIMMLVMIWGTRIRGYENPFEQYGLDFTSVSKIQNFLKGLVGGVMLVLSIHTLNVLIGCVRLSWPSTLLSYPSDAVTWLKVFGKMLLLVGQGIITATGVALVEELLFRSWLPDEIATDLGYYRGIILSGLAFSLFQRSPWAIPGLWLLSLGLAGARQRSQGSLSVPIGLRSGIMASSFVLQMGGFLTYQPNFPVWIINNHPLQPFSGISGVAFALLLAIVLYPRQPLDQQKNTRPIRE